MQSQPNFSITTCKPIAFSIATGLTATNPINSLKGTKKTS